MIVWGIVPFTIAKDTPFEYVAGDFVFVPGIREAIVSGKEEIDAQVITKEGVKPIHLFFQNLTADERTILEKGCLMNYYNNLAVKRNTSTVLLPPSAMKSSFLLPPSAMQ